MVFILTELYYPEDTSTGYYLTKITEFLSQNQTVKVVTAPATIDFIPMPNYPSYEQRNSVKIWRCWGTKFNKNYFWGRAINELSRSFFIFLKACQLCQKDDLVIVITNPPVLPFFALLLKRLKKIKLVVLIHDLYPEVLVATDLLTPHSPITKLGQRMNQLLFKNATQIITIGRDMAQRIYHYLEYQHKEKIAIIPHWADLDLISPQFKESNLLLESLKLSDKFIILYSGNMGRTHPLEDIIDVAKKLNNDPSIHFIIAGKGHKRSFVEQQILHHQLTNVTLLNPYPRSQLNILLNACDIAIVGLIRGMTGVSVPSRIYNHLASGKPILAIAESSTEIAQIIREDSVGWVVSPANITELLYRIKWVEAHPKKCLQKGYQAVKIAQEKYSFATVIDNYQKLLSQLSNPTQIDHEH